MSLVERALAAPAAQRRACVEAACEGDSTLFDEVWQCVEWEERMQGFLAAPLVSPPPDSPPPEAPFAPGDVLLGRFRIVREVARGGMGIVYEAYDEKLERRVALKCARAGFGSRLPPEVRNAGEISHPHVCKIFEIHTAATAQGEVDFFTMEFLEGETLAGRLARGPLPRGEAREVALQICAGLAAAHRRQVIHGDLKCGNVILSVDPEGRPRAVITDFGLARRPGAGLHGPLQSAPAGGTPDYMAPELMEGARATPASDIYALGVILRKLAGPHPAAASKWTRVPARCLNPDPAARYGSAAEVEAALAYSTRRRWLLAGAAALLVAGSGAVTWRAATRPAETVRIAALPVQVWTPELQAAAQRLEREIPAELARIRATARTGFAALPAAVPASRLTHGLQVSLRRDGGGGGGIALHAQVSDVRTSAPLREWNAVYQGEQELRYAPRALAGVVTETFRLAAAVEAAEVRPEALFEYREGMRALRRNVTLTAALGHLEQAVAIDPASPLPHAALAEVNWRLFQLTGEPDLLADSLAALGAAERRNPDLAEVHRAASLPKLRDGKTEEALAHLTRAIELAPTNAEAYRRLGNTQLAANRAELALAAYRRAVELEPGDYRNHQGLGSFYMHSQQVDYQEAARHFRRAAELEPEDPVLHFALGSALLDQGKFAEAEACLRRSLELQERPDTLNTLGVALMYQKRDAEAVPYLRKAAEAPPGEVLRWMNLATAHHHLGRKAEARRADLRGFELAERAVSQNPRDGYARASMALLCARLGERRRAESEAAQALLLTPADADTRWMAVKTYEFLGLRERALEVLARSTRDHLADIARHPDMAGLRADPRFQSMLGSFQSKSHDSRRQ